MKQKALTVIILTKNEKKRIRTCIESVSFADEIIVVDDESTDNTREIAKKCGATVFQHTKKDFADQRNFGLSKATGTWVLYLDADEIVSKDLTDEIRKITKGEGTDDIVAYKISRQNYYLGKKWPHVEKLERLFQKQSLAGWFGEVHESPRFHGTLGDCKHSIMHNTHRTLSEMVAKTIEWSDIEAQLRFQAHHPPIVWWRLPKVMIGAFWEYYIRQGGWRVGTIGVIESIYQAFSIFITYAKLWELQNKKV